MDGWLQFIGAHLHASKDPIGGAELSFSAALVMSGADVREHINFCCGFESVGAVLLEESRVRSDVNCNGRFVNPGKVSLSLRGTSAANVMMLPQPWFKTPGSFESDGIVELINARIEGVVAVGGAKFGGKASDPHGFRANGLSARAGFVWQAVDLENGAFLDLSGANVGQSSTRSAVGAHPGTSLLTDSHTQASLRTPHQVFRLLATRGRSR